MEGWLFGPLNPWLRGFLVLVSVVILYPPQLPVFGINDYEGYALTVAGAIGVIGIHLWRKANAASTAPAGV
jgi:hypothetical protein